ncbi:ran-binding protein 3 [Cochliomyia hominivorax]
MSENNDNSNESNSMGSDSILQSSRLTGGGSVGGNPVLRAGVLRPSVLGPSRLGSALTNNSTTNNVTSSNDASDGGVSGGAATASDACAGAGNESVEKKSSEKLINPFLKDHKDDEEGGEDNENKNSESATDNGDQHNEEVDERPDPLSLLRKNGMERSNLFAAAKSSIPLVEKSGFVFGQNVHERVVGDNLKTDSATTSDNTGSSTSASDEGLLFSSVIQNAAKSSEGCDTASGKDTNTEAKSLTEVAREYEESRAQKRKLEEVETFTGEENEVNVVDVNCKLFAFVNSNWEERGRGGLRLNDSKIEHECSRLVFRTAGNLRLLLNAKVWAGMVVERPSQKSLRLTAMDNTGKIKIFLVMARPVEINQLHSALVERIDKRKISHPDELLCASSNSSGEHSSEDIKNGTAKHLAAEAAAAAEPDHDDSTEPSPKKVILSTDEPSLNVQQQEASNN